MVGLAIEGSARRRKELVENSGCRTVTYCAVQIDVQTTLLQKTKGFVFALFDFLGIKFRLIAFGWGIYKTEQSLRVRFSLVAISLILGTDIDSGFTGEAAPIKDVVKLSLIVLIKENIVT